MEEAAIRRVIAEVDNIANSANTAANLYDPVLWSGAYKKPFIRGVETPEPKTEPPDSIQNRVDGPAKEKGEPIRIVIAESGDLAYEYSKKNVQFDLKSGAHANFDTGVLRVWQKQGGSWKIAAWFQRPYDK